MGTQEKPAKIDRRAMRSKRLILGALRELILEKEYKEISVTDIVQRADIGRATFYAHFEDKDALGRFMFQQLLQQIEQEIQTTLDADTAGDAHYQQLVPSLALFRIAQDKHRWFKMNATNSEIGLGMLIPPLIQRMEKRLDEMNRPNAQEPVPTKISATFLLSGLIALLTEWVVTDMPETPEAMDAMYQALAAPTLNRILGM